jgi:hypothetical protein
MVALDVLKVGPDNKLQVVRVTIRGGVVVCKDDSIRRAVKALRDPRGPSGSDPEPDWTLARECVKWMPARIVKQTRSGGSMPPGSGVVP